MRTFIAIEIPEEVKAAIAAIQDDLRQARAEVSWTKPENIHLTLKFLGEIDESLIEPIESACVETAKEFSAFSLSVNGVGAFPNAHHPRVLWAGLADEVEELKRMQAALDERLVAAGFAREARAFSPHLTFGRVKSSKNNRSLISRLNVYQLPIYSFIAREIILMRSQLHPAGARYTPLKKAQLMTEQQ
jgi:2'-5' RNA ligase